MKKERVDAALTHRCDLEFVGPSDRMKLPGCPGSRHGFASTVIDAVAPMWLGFSVQLTVMGAAVP